VVKIPDINTGDSSPQEGRTYATGFWDSETCYNSLALFPSGTDPSWGNLSFYLNGCDEDNYIDLTILDDSYNTLYSKKFVSNGKKTIDLSQIYAITSSQDIKVRIQLTTYV